MSVVVSIIMPAYNAEMYISESIESVLKQTYHNWELIIIDDGSIDSTGSIIKKYTDIDNRIKYSYQENGKQGKARNFGISISSGIYIAFIDSDDIWSEDKLEMQINEITNYNVDFVFSDVKILNSNEAGNIISGNFNSFKGTLRNKADINKIIKNNLIPILTVFIKKKVLLDVGLFSEHIKIQNAEDYHLWLKILLSGYNAYGSQKIFAIYRIHPFSVTSIDKCASEKLPFLYFDIIKMHPLKISLYFSYFNSLFRKYL